MANYSKVARAVAFDPQTAFPLDARSLMTKAEAEAAASKAKEVGDTSTTFYYGMSIQVIEDGVVNTYVITPDNKLAQTASSVDTKLDKKTYEDFVDGYEGKQLSAIIAEAKLEGGSGEIDLDSLKDIFAEKDHTHPEYLTADDLPEIPETPFIPEYSVVSGSDDDYAAVYTLQKTLENGNIENVGTINIPKDIVVKSGEVVTDPTDKDPGTYLKLVLSNDTATEIFINVGDLIEYVTSGSKPTDDIILSIDSDNKVTATLNSNIVDKINKAHSHSNSNVLDSITSDVITIVSGIKGIDDVVTENSENIITSGAVYSELSKKSDIGHTHSAYSLTDHNHDNVYAKKTDIPSLDGLASENWVKDQGYLTEVPEDAYDGRYSKLGHNHDGEYLKELPNHNHDDLYSKLDHEHEQYLTELPEHTHDQYLTASDLPTKVSDLTNDLGFVDGDYVSKEIAKIDKLTKKLIKSVNLSENKVTLIDNTVVTALENVIYLLNVGSDYSDNYREYTLIDGKLTLIGDTSTNLSDYYTKNDVDDKFSKLDHSHDDLYSKLGHDHDGVYLTELPEHTHDQYLTELPEHSHEEYLTLDDVDSSLSDSSTNPVQNKVVKAAIDTKLDTAAFDTFVNGETGTLTDIISAKIAEAELKGEDDTVDLSIYAKQSDLEALDSREANRLVNSVINDDGSYAINITTSNSSLLDTIKNKKTGMFTTFVKSGMATDAPTSDSDYRGISMIDGWREEVVSEETGETIVKYNGWIILISDDNHPYTRIISDGVATGWKQLDKEYELESVDPLLVKTTQEYQTTTGVGTITANGTPVTFLNKGDSLHTFFSLFMEKLKPSVTKPSVSNFKLTNSGAKEVGTKISPAYSYTFSSGSYPYKTVEDNTSTATGVTITSGTITGKNGSTTVNSVSSTSTTGSLSEIKVSDGMNYKLYLSVTHSDGRIPLYNTGERCDDEQIKSATKTATSSNAITSCRYMFTKLLDEDVNDRKTITNVRTEMNKTDKTGKSTTVSVSNCNRVLIAYPKSWGALSKIVDANTNYDILSAFSISEIDVPDLNAETDADKCTYYLYSQESSVTLSSTYTLS